MTKQQLDEIRERVEAAVSGPWFPCGARYTYISRELSDVEIEDVAEVCNHYRDETQIEKNKQFIAHARTDIPALLEHIESLQGRLKEARKVILNTANADCPRYVAHPQSVWFKEHVQKNANAYIEKYPGNKSGFNEMANESHG